MECISKNNFSFWNNMSCFNRISALTWRHLIFLFRCAIACYKWWVGSEDEINMKTNWNGHLWLSIQWDVVCANAQNNYWEHKRRIKVVKLQMWIHFTTYQITMGSGTPLVQNCTTQLLRGFFLWNTKNTFLERFIYVWWTCIHQMMLYVNYLVFNETIY